MSAKQGATGYPLSGDLRGHLRSWNPNHAIATAMYEAEQGLCLIDELLAREELANYPLA